METEKPKVDWLKVGTGAVVVTGAIALAVCAKYGVDKEVIAAVGSVLLVLAGSLRSMLPGRTS